MSKSNLKCQLVSSSSAVAKLIQSYFFLCRNENDSALHLVAGANNLEDSSSIAERLISRNVGLNIQNRQGL